MSLVADQISLSLSGSEQLLHSVSLEVSPAELVVLIGPNGAGKSSLMKTMAGVVPPDDGRLQLDKVNFADVKPAERARRLAYLPQKLELAWPNKVRDVVALGRYAYGASPGRLTGDDRLYVEEALSVCDLTQFADRRADTLSGGEVSRMHFARILAGQPQYILADEPVAALDPRQQFRIMELILSFVKAGGGALIVLHDLQLAARYADKLVWLDKGRVVSTGKVADTMTAERISSVYGVEANIEHAEQGLKVSFVGPTS